ncbi:MAG: putative virulence factor [Pseudomonas sp.]|uniref:putative virulence factor n=1 Tax=Pseudomonas sp. TaxID=306 RepID=UPI00271F7DE8|nr:putative virulence factor [Pseudomonas sp.]MDO9617516.1 putative virulence factor [Pseudomonas sp.]MDP2443853.1 putative virulence factor [Pseudomonas sp.]MDZ4334488.1 putative virulence factor [Pseudomonas sp.]
MSNSPEQLTQHWSAIHSGAGDAIRWINDVRRTAPRLDNEADDLILSLRRVRNTADRLGGVSNLPMTVGFFGLSQAGKSYLISTLAAGANGKLETDFGGSRLDFLTHVNPPGGGKEATGLVTRFSRTAKPGPNDFPLELKLFAEVELAKVLANSFFNDFNTEKVLYRLDESAIRQLLKELGKRRQLSQVPGVSEDDVVALWDYLQDNFPASISGLAGYYWPAAVELAPWLSLEDRSKLFSIFWGEIDELSEAYLSFAKTLSRLGNADRVFAPLDALVRQTDKGLSQADSIMNVDMLERLGRDSDKPVSVRPFSNGELQAAVELTLAQLAVLTAELVFPLVEPTSDPLFEQVDLLDFPGYRGRLSVESLDDVRRAVSSDEASPVAQLILRGKVAYLFERYTDSQEMNVLIVCTPSNKQSDVTAVGPVLTRWIEKTQGAKPEERALRKPGLLWAITMFDMRITSDLDKGEDLLRLGWGSGGMMKMTMLERFGQYTWLQEWTDNQPFNNTFLVRKPRMKVTFLDVLDGNEIGINTASQDSLTLMHNTFAEDETVQRHVHQPAQAWAAMLELNDGGMSRISQYLRGVALREVKLGRIREQLDEVVHLLDNRLGHWFQAEGAGELEKKRKIAQQIFEMIWPRRVLLGELLQKMQLPDDLLRGLYLNAGEDAAQPVTSEKTADGPASGGALNLGNDFASDDGFSLFGDVPAAPTASNAVRSTGSDARFAQAVLREWISHLRHLPEDVRLLTFLGFSKPAVEALVDELVTAANRLNLQERLLRTIVSTEQIGTKREQLAGRQVLTAKTLLGDFIGWLGFIDMPLELRPDSRIEHGAKLFQAPPAIAPGRLPELTPQPLEHSRNYVGDWLVALSKVAEDNAGHSAGREITPEQNEALGKVLATLHANRTE